jgi:TrbC/VIRB2 pilin
MKRPSLFTNYYPFFAALIAASFFLLPDLALAQTALPGEVEKGAGLLEALLKSKWVIMFGAGVIAFFGYQVSQGKADLSRFFQVSIGCILMFGAIPIAYFMMRG